MTFEKKPIEPRAYKALDRVVAATRGYATAPEDECGTQARLRATAINYSRAWGMTYDTIARALGVSRERVRQMVKREKS